MSVQYLAVFTLLEVSQSAIHFDTKSKVEMILIVSNLFGRKATGRLPEFSLDMGR